MTADPLSHRAIKANKHGDLSWRLNVLPTRKYFPIRTLRCDCAILGVVFASAALLAG
jgi:hypothetical protein